MYWAKWQEPVGLCLETVKIKRTKKNSIFAALGNQRTNVHFLLPAFGCRSPISHWPGRWFFVAGLDNNWPGAGPGNKTCSMQLAIPPPSVPSCQNLHFYASAVLGASGSRCCFIFLFTARTLKSPKHALSPTSNRSTWPTARRLRLPFLLRLGLTHHDGHTPIFWGAWGGESASGSASEKIWHNSGNQNIWQDWQAPFWKG